jgi:hypothetical protein
VQQADFFIDTAEACWILKETVTHSVPVRM